MASVARWSRAVPALTALLALSCGRSLRHGDPGAGGSSSPMSDAGDATSAGVGGSGGSPVQPGIDAGADRPPATLDAALDVVDARAPDLLADLSQMPDVAGCPVDCTQLPHVRAGVPVSCANGICVLGYGSCEDGFAHCSFAPNVGCETDLTNSPNCGICGNPCSGDDVCRNINGFYDCRQACQAPTPDACGFACLDLQNDPGNCGTCGNACYVSSSRVACQQGQCVTLGCTDSTVADCTSDPGCETSLGYPSNCGGCNDPACTVANTMFTCSDGLGCNASVCEVGTANCDTSSPDCETLVESTTPTSGGCLPQYAGTVALATQNLIFTPVAIAPDGSFFIGGAYQGMVDFDPSPTGTDLRTADDPDGFITKFNADGSYAWTATLGGTGSLTLLALAVTPSGGVVAAGSYLDTIDLDPSGAHDIHVTDIASSSNPYIVELSANGSEVWGRTFSSTSIGSGGATAGMAVGTDGAVYVVGSFSGTMDFDPGAGGDVRTAVDGTAFLVKLTSTGDHAWSQIMDDPGCASNLQAVAVGTDGSAWATGSVSPTTTCALTPVAGPYASVLIVKVDAAGDARTTWSLGDSLTLGGSAIAASRDGAIYIGGLGSGAMDMDPGPGVARRWLGSLNGFVLKLAADGTYQWARSLSAATDIDALAPAPDGGVIAAGNASGRFVTRLTASGSSAWTIPIGASLVRLTSLASNQTSFVVGGISSQDQDFDPGPGVDHFDGDLAFASRFTF